MKVILLIMIGLSMLHAEFVKSGDIVKDTISKLEWQDDAVVSTMKWEAAISHCEELTLGEYDDWRLPNINELKSIVDRSKVRPAIVDAFTHTSSSDYYWSSTRNEGSKRIVHFRYGSVNSSYEDSNYYVRCVRAGQ